MRTKSKGRTVRRRRYTFDELIERGEQRTAFYIVFRLPPEVSAQTFAEESGLTLENVRKMCQMRTVRANKQGGQWSIPRTELIPFVQEWIRTCSLETLELMKSK